MSSEERSYNSGPMTRKEIETHLSDSGSIYRMSKTLINGGTIKISRSDNEGVVIKHFMPEDTHKKGVVVPMEEQQDCRNEQDLNVILKAKGVPMIGTTELKEDPQYKYSAMTRASDLALVVEWEDV